MRRCREAYPWWRRLGFGFTLIELLVVVSIIAILASMLLPAMAAAREKARRTCCISQLKQQGVAIESYVSDYGGYFPGWPGVAFREADNPWKDVGVFKDPRLDSSLNPSQAVQTVTTCADEDDYANAVSNGSLGNWRAIAAYGASDSSDKPDGRATRMVPIKMGMLLAGGYLSDVGVMYCPSGRDMPETCGRTGTSDLRNLSQLRRLGGYSPSSLFYGDYSWANHSPRGPDYGYRMEVRCDYNYRPNIMGANSSAHMANEKTWLGGTSPLAQGWNGAQVFPTRKTLGHRALLCDTFAKGSTPGVGQTQEQRESYYARYAGGNLMHMNGYNVLFGDYHVTWYGDPGKRIVWWRRSMDTSSWYKATMYGGGFHRGIVMQTDPCADSKKLPQSLGVWHLLDTAVGIDIEAEFTPLGDNEY